MILVVNVLNPVLVVGLAVLRLGPGDTKSLHGLLGSGHPAASVLLGVVGELGPVVGVARPGARAPPLAVPAARVKVKPVPRGGLREGPEASPPQ